MKTFIKNVIIYISLFFGLVLLIELSTALIINRHANFKFELKPKYLVLGHSHPECAFNDSIIYKLKNIARSAEPYYYTYFKLKKVLEQNSSIETIFIEYTNNQINPEMDDWTWDDEHISSRYVNYSPFIPLNHQFILLLNNPTGFFNAFSYSNKSKFINIVKEDYDYTNKLGGYLYLVRDKTDSILKNTSKIDPKNSITISKTNISYLEKTIELIKRHKKNVFLIRSPQHPKCVDYKNETIYKHILFSRFNDVEYLDFSNFPLSNSEFGDLEHLNHKGAKKFSIWFNKLIKDGLLLKANKQEFININIQKNKKTIL
ncbi:hypothetical protein [Flavobacterium sharifuzzamanii]|uniref:hypothetical protein n=1 Tax=Flavobacterium sharifuzzamanii TaxID=2211133 RepID=UPI000DAC3BDB|nr:hypothetical protein [Flavobacterium sharifuzzamanii]KAF2080420.1 hypothetical protein DMA14_14075 [Flavobacterium sharifuzzamanii]